MSIIRLSCYGRKLSVVSRSNIFSGAVNANSVKFTFDNEWDGYTKTAVFYVTLDKVYNVLMTDDQVDIVPEVLTEEGYFHIGVFGVKGDSVLPSSVLKYDVGKGIITTGGNVAEELTPSLYVQLLARLSNIATLKEGSTTGDAELIDARVGVYGETYDSAGEAVREQFAREENRVDSLINGIIEPCGRQILEWSYVVTNASIDIYTGVKVASTEEYSCIDKFMVIDRNEPHYYAMDKDTRTYLYFYDQDKKYISYAYVATSGELAKFPENALYLKAAFIRNSETDVVSSRDIRLLEGAERLTSKLLLNDNSITAEKCAFFVRDLLNQDEIEYNMVFNPEYGNVYETTDLERSVSGFIDVTAVKKITTNFKFYIAYYDEKFKFIGDLTDTLAHDPGTYAIPEHKDLVYMRVLLLTNDSAVASTYHISNCEEPFETENKLQKAYLPTDITTSWYKGKKIAVFGDSITEGNKWQPYVASAFGCEMVNCGIGGTTVANNGNTVTVNGVAINSWMCGDDRIALIPEDSDMIILFGGANDWGQNAIEMGEIGTELSDATFKSAYALMIKKIVNKFPGARIVALTPINGRTSVVDANEDYQFYVRNLCLADFSEAVKEVCHYYGVPCIDVHGNSGINVFNHTTYIADIVHPNSEGGKKIANEVINGLKRFEPIDFNSL